MKRCPECRRDYFDDSLIYCLDDGAALLEGPSARETKTVILPDTEPDRTKLFDEGANVQSPTRFTARRRSGLLMGFLVVIALTGAGFAIYRYTRVRPPINFQSVSYTHLRA